MVLRPSLDMFVKTLPTGMEPQFLDHTPYSLITALTILSQKK